MLHVLGLRFRDDVLEADYTQHRVLKGFLPLDRFGLVWAPIQIASIYLGRLGQMSGFPAFTSSEVGLLMIGPMLSWIVVGFALYQADTWRKIRGPILVLYRCIAFPLVTIGCCRYWYVNPPTGSGRFVMFLFRSCKLLDMMVMGLFMPLFLRSHVPAQAATLISVTALHTPMVCGGAVGEPQVDGIFLRIWDHLTGASMAVLNGMYLSPLNDPVRPDPLVACEHVTTLWLVVMGFVVPTFVVWRWEHLSRLRFLRSRPSQEVPCEDCSLWSHRNLLRALLYALALQVFLAVSWQSLIRMHAAGPELGGLGRVCRRIRDAIQSIVPPELCGM